MSQTLLLEQEVPEFLNNKSAMQTKVVSEEEVIQTTASPKNILKILKDGDWLFIEPQKKNVDITPVNVVMGSCSSAFSYALLADKGEVYCRPPNLGEVGIGRPRSGLETQPGIVWITHVSQTWELNYP